MTPNLTSQATERLLRVKPSDALEVWEERLLEHDISQEEIRAIAKRSKRLEEALQWECSPMAEATAEIHRFFNEPREGKIKDPLELLAGIYASLGTEHELRIEALAFDPLSDSN